MTNRRAFRYPLAVPERERARTGCRDRDAQDGSRSLESIGATGRQQVQREGSTWFSILPRFSSFSVGSMLVTSSITVFMVTAYVLSKTGE
jgi:hypothetical protein